MASEKFDLKNVIEDSGSNRSEEQVSITDRVAENSLDGQLASNEDRDMQVWPLFRANSVFVFNSMSKEWGPKLRERNLKVLLVLNKRIGRKGSRIQIIPLQITSRASASNQTKFSPQLNISV